MIAALKLLHITALSIWCAGLIGLPVLLAKHHPHHDQHAFSRLRILSHQAYVGIVTPAAVTAIAAGTALIFLRGVFVPWMFAKLVLVGFLVLLHSWIGHVTLMMGERQGRYQSLPLRSLLAITLTTILGILLLVLAKPSLSETMLPGWLLRPQYHPLPVDEMPI